eukprot:6172979-Pleurochrysis_carterae.AAC.5
MSTRRWCACALSTTALLATRRLHCRSANLASTSTSSACSIISFRVRDRTGSGSCSRSSTTAQKAAALRSTKGGRSQAVSSTPATRRRQSMLRTPRRGRLRRANAHASSSTPPARTPSASPCPR